MRIGGQNAEITLRKPLREVIIVVYGAVNYREREGDYLTLLLCF